MKVLVACDKFKGSISATDLCQLISDELQSLDARLVCYPLPLADGGDGTLDILAANGRAEKVFVPTIDPLGRDIQAYYLKDGSQAFIELAEASGMSRLAKDELDVLNTTTIGTGRLMQHAIANGCKDIVLGLGGSCTNDMGLGILDPLGFKYFDKDKHLLTPNGGNLDLIDEIHAPDHIADFNLSILCDVENPLYGPEGAAFVYGPQKGANEEMVLQLDRGMRSVSDLIQKQFKKDVSQLKGVGAAGGCSAGLYGLLDKVEMKSGMRYISNVMNLNEKIQACDLIITGEGKIDQSSFNGKVVGFLYKQAKKTNKDIIAIVGINDVSSNIDIPIYDLLSQAGNMARSQAESVKYLKETVVNIYQEQISLNL